MPETNNVICQLHLYKRIKRVKIVQSEGGVRGGGRKREKTGRAALDRNKDICWKPRERESLDKKSQRVQEPKWGSLIS